MRDHSLHALALTLLATASLATGCPADRDPPPEADSTGGESSEGTTASSVSATSQGSLSSADTTDGVMTDGMDSAGFLPGDTTDDGPIPPQPNGTPCGSPLECESGYCYQIPMLGGVCSECLMDENCKTGTCSIDFGAGYAICTDGGIGLMCNTDEGCMGDLICAELIDTGGLFPLNFCSECRDDVPCMDGDICSPVYDIAMFQGYQACLPPASVPDGGGCPLVGPVGDGTVCQSGHCAVALLLDLIPIGVCGECVDDMDCMGPSTCQPPTADMSGLMPSVCI